MQVSLLLTIDPRKRSTAKELLLRLKDEKKKGYELIELAGNPANSSLYNPVFKICSSNLHMMNISTEVETKLQFSDPPFILISSSGPAADHQSALLGLYRKTTEIIEGRRRLKHQIPTQNCSVPKGSGVFRMMLVK